MCLDKQLSGRAVVCKRAPCVPRPSDEFRDVTVVAFGTPPETTVRSNDVMHIGELATEGLVLAYNAADVFVSGAVEDNLPNTVLEALSCGTPVAAFDSGGIKDVVIEGDTGYLATTGNVYALARAIAQVLRASSETTRHLQLSARKRVEAGHDYRVQAGAYRRLYEEILERRRAIPQDLIGY